VVDSRLGVENPQRRYTEKRLFDSWDELYAQPDWNLMEPFEDTAVANTA
jgi:hypothetical protein